MQTQSSPIEHRRSSALRPCKARLSLRPQVVPTRQACVNLRRTVLMIHKTTSLAPHGAANSHNLYAIVERPVGLAAIQRGGSLASLECATAKLLDHVFSLRSNLPSGESNDSPFVRGSHRIEN